MSGTATQVVLQVDAGPDADDEEMAELALRLRDDLEALDVGSSTSTGLVRPRPGA